MAFLDRAANRGSISTGSYQIDYSLKLEADNSEYLGTGNISTTPTDAKIGTYSCWVKRTELGTNYLFVTGNSARYSRIFFNSDDKIQLYAGDSSWNSVQPITNAVYRDTAAWYHIVLRIDTTDGTAANRLRLYVNGVEQTWGTAPNINQNATPTLLEAFGSPGYHAWGRALTPNWSTNDYFSGYLAEVHYVDGQSLAPTEFGEFDSDSGIWKPIEYEGTYGTVGYYLDFADADNLGDNESGTSLPDFTENNIAAIDQSTDTPTNNFCTLSPLWNFTNNPTITEGGTKSAPSNAWSGAKATMGLSSGKWYWEWKASSQGNYMGVQTDGEDNIHSGNAQNNQMGAFFVHDGEFKIYDADSTSGRNDVDIDYAAFNSAHIFACALDMDNNRISFYQNGTIIPDSAGGRANAPGNYDLDGLSDKTVFPTAAQYDVTFEWNFGGCTAFSISSAQSDENGYGTFEHAPPSGYLAICTKNLAENGG
jgi:hypothetical protein